MNNSATSDNRTKYGAHNDRRLNPRVNVRGLQVAIEKRKWIWFKDYHECLLYDICLDGIGIVANGLNLKPQQPVQLMLSDNDYQYLVEGKVVFGNELDEFVWYGIAFENSPSMLDRRIERWARVAFMQRELKRKQKLLKLQVQRQQQEQRQAEAARLAAAKAAASRVAAAKTATPPAPPAPAYKRREDRLKIPALQVRIRSWGLDHFSEFVDGTIMEIGQYGLSIRIPPQSELTERVRLEIQVEDKPLRLVGRICYREPVGDSLLCGIELLQVPVAYGQLYQQFLAEQKALEKSRRGDHMGSVSA